MARASKSSSSLRDLSPYGIFVLRLALGACMVYRGYGKVVPDNAMDHFAHTIVSLGLPYWLGYIFALTEFAGGILILFGLLTRFAAVLVALNMLVVLVKVDAHHNAEACQLSMMLLAAAIALACTGGGAYALDHKIGFA
jgi:putative oxidoreductase